MKRIQIHIEDELDHAAEAEAARRGISKAALIRESLAERLSVKPAAHGDPWDAMIGWLDDGPVADLDKVVYRRRK